MSPDDVRVGQMVTVRQWAQPREAEGYRDDWGPFFAPPQAPARRTDHMGDVMRVVAVSLPYVAVAFAFSNHIKILDLRDCELTEVTPEYVSAMRQMYEQKARRRPPSTGGWLPMAPMQFGIYREDDDE